MTEFIGNALTPKRVQSMDDLVLFLKISDITVHELELIRYALVLSLRDISANQYNNVKIILKSKLKAFLGAISILSPEASELLRIIISSGSYGRVLTYLNAIIKEHNNEAIDKDKQVKQKAEKDRADFIYQTHKNIKEYLDLLAERVGKDVAYGISRLISGKTDSIYIVSCDNKFSYNIVLLPETIIERADAFMQLAFFDEDLRRMLAGDFFVLEVM